jgi:D-lyxose ketol-isomerase
MKRSEINEILLASDRFIRSFGFIMPPFAYWSPAEMKARTASDSALIRDMRLGWDITDYGQGSFADLGLFLFTVRNGSQANVAAGRGVLYAEKIMISRQNQISPMHRHNDKTEDIINRGGATLALELFAAKPDGSIDPNAPVDVLCDGTMRSLAPGGILALEPGESVTLMPHHWHAFWGEGGDVLIGEVSNVNDDLNDNIFREKIGRFADVAEDVAPVHLLVADYDSYL